MTKYSAIIFCSILSLFSLSAVADEHQEVNTKTNEDVPPLTDISSVMQAVINTHPVIDSRRAFVKVNKFAIDEQRSTYFPSIDLELGSGIESSMNSTTRANFGGNGKYQNLRRHEGRLVLTQRIFDSLETPSRTRSARNRYSSAQNQLLDGGELIGLQAVEVYLDVMRQRALVDIAQSSVSTHNDFLSIIKKRESAGYDKRADVFQASSRLSLAQTRLETQKGDLAESVSRFIEIVGQRPQELKLPKFNNELINKNVDEAIKLAMEANPSVKSAADNTSAAKSDIRITYAPFMPSLNLELSATQNENLDGVKGQNDDFQAFLRMRYNLFRGGADLSRKRQAVATHQQFLADEAEVRRFTRENIRRSYDAIQEAQSQIQRETAHVASAKQLVASYKSQFEIGTRSLLALLDAEDERFIAEANLKNQEFILLFEKYRLLANIGVLLPSHDISIPSSDNQS